MEIILLVNIFIFIAGIIIYISIWKLFKKKSDRETDDTILMRPITVVDVDFKGSIVKGVVDPHHSTAGGTWIFDHGCFYHKLGSTGKWELSKKISLTPARVAMLARLMRENNINYKLIEKSC